MTTRLVAVLYIVGMAVGLVPFTAMAQDKLLQDTLLTQFSVEDLVKIRKMLARERDKLLREQEKIRQRGVDVTREFLGKTKEENANQDKILIRVAEYYIEEEELDFDRRYQEYEKQYEQYEKLLKAYENGQLKAPPAEPAPPRRNYEKAIAIYDLIIRNFPESDLVDDAYYNKAYLLEEMEEVEAARQIFQTIIDEFPESPYAPEAYMKLAESYFYPEPGDDMAKTIVKLNKAIQLYKNVLQYKDSPRYDEALYKLGWSYYRLAGENPEYYTDAILYFLAVVKDIEKLKDLDPTGKLVRTDVKPEALEFIAASFVDSVYSKSGVTNARRFLERMGMPEFGIKILENMGDRYAKITRWQRAIEAYSTLLDMYPDYAYGPRIQKKIADAYIASGQEDRAFEERQALFERYNPKSEWYAQLEQSDIPDRITALDEAYRITEEAFRANITYLYALASQKEENEEDARPLYEQFVDLCKSYLTNFPTDDNAYEINWALAFVLDTKLGRFEEAFTEYIRVSNDYLETAHQLDAAVNAINAADTLVKIALAKEEPPPQQAGSPVQPLIPEEKMLAEAYDNFIKLFPNSPETPSVLAAAGALYYNHRQYDLAKKYYKTMVTKFPKAQQKSIGLVSLMNSYFFLGQYKDAEIVAKKILVTPDMPEKQVEIARSRIGESIFKNGEKLEQEGKYLEAAKEYRRVFEDAAEYVTFVDQALFRSARNFEQAGEWNKAIETYEILLVNYPDSKLILPALNNIAADYKELEDYLNVAKTNERIFELFPGTPDAESALYNASLFYAKAEAWREAIRANNLYIQTYPNNPESKDLLFENAKYYLKLDDLASANRIYQKFATLYPNDPLTVEAFYNRGVYYFERARYDSAKIEFNKAIQKSNEFARAGRDPNLYYAAEANYKLGEILYKEYLAIELGAPQANLRAQLQRKKDKLEQVRAAFTEVIRLGSLRSFEAMYRIAEAYEKFADAIANQRLPENLTREQRLVEQDRVFKASVPAYERAVEEYKNVLINLPILAEKLDISLDTTRVEEAAQPAPRDTTGAVVQKEVEADSSTEVALKWFGRAKEKISQILYNVAERSSYFITEYLRTENPNTGIRALIFRDQVLVKLVAPQVQTAIDAHLKNIQVSEELGLENKYVEESKRKVLLTRNILAEEYQALFEQTAQLYSSSLPVLEDLIERGESAKTPDGMDYYDYQDTYLMQLIYSMNQFSKIAVNQYKATLEIAQKYNITNDARITTEQNLFNFGYEAGERMANLAKIPAEKSEFYLDKYDSTENENYQLGSTFFDDQAFELRGFSQEIFEYTYNISKEFEIENIWTQLILAKLVELDPATYAADLPREEFVIQSDSTWLTTTQYQPGWNYREFTGSGWEYARVIPVPPDSSVRLFDSLQIAPPAIWARHVTPAGAQPASGSPLNMEDRSLEEEAPEDTTGAGQVPPPTDSLSRVATGEAMDTVSTSVGGVVEPDTLTTYYRKQFTLSADPVAGWIAIGGDKAFNLYINDVYMIGVEQGGFRKSAVIPFETFSEFVKAGENLIAVSVTDFDGPPRYGLRFYMVLELLPGEATASIEKIRQRIRQQNIDLARFKKVAVLNRNRIVQ